MLAALCHDLGKPAATEYVRGRIHAYDHESAGVPLADALVRRIVGEKAAAAYVRNMVQLHMKPNALWGPTPPSRPATGCLTNHWSQRT